MASLRKIRTRYKILLAFVALVAFMSSSQAAEINSKWKKKSARCMACHGKTGISNNYTWPNLAGQNKSYLIAQMKAYKEGRRVNLMMTPLSKRLSEQDIEMMASYFSSFNTNGSKVTQ